MQQGTPIRRLRYDALLFLAAPKEPAIRRRGTRERQAEMVIVHIICAATAGSLTEVFPCPPISFTMPA